MGGTVIWPSEAQHFYRGHMRAWTESNRQLSASKADSHQSSFDDVEERFWSKVNKAGPTLRPEIGPCWEWTASKDQDGYGYFYPFGKRHVRAHRFARLLAGDDVQGLVVRHRCDNPGCVRHDHLVTGTVAENVADRQAKGRGQRGETNHSAKLTEEQVSAILADPMTATAIAASYGVGREAITKIKRRENRRHVGAPR